MHCWKMHNGSTAYAVKLNDLFKKAVKLIATHPRIGRLSNVDDVRIKLVKDYLLIYEVKEETVHVLAVWHGSRNPEELGIKDYKPALLNTNQCSASS